MNYETEYVNNAIERAKKAINFRERRGNVRFEAVRGDERLTIDGKNFFRTVTGVKIFCQDILMCSYDFDKKRLYHYKGGNIISQEIMCDIINDYLGGYLYVMKPDRLIAFAEYKEDVDPDGNLSDFELAEMFKYAGR